MVLEIACFLAQLERRHAHVAVHVRIPLAPARPGRAPPAARLDRHLDARLVEKVEGDVLRLRTRRVGLMTSNFTQREIEIEGEGEGEGEAEREGERE